MDSFMIVRINKTAQLNGVTMTL